MLAFSSRSEPAGRERASHLLVAGFACFAVAILVLAAGQVMLRLPQRFGIDYGEGFVWGQVGDLLAGRIYRPLGEYPYALMHYTPLYHAVVAALWRLGFDPLMAGRAVSLVSGVVLAGASGLMAALALPEDRPRERKLIAGLAAAMLIAAMPEVIEWSTVMRVDMLATSLGMLGLLALRLRGRGPTWTVAAGLCFLLALLTKQNTLVPAVAGIAALLITEPRAALRLGGALAAIGLTSIGAAELATHGEFLRHVVLYDAARINWDQMITLWIPHMLDVAVPLPIAIGFALVRLRRLGRERTWRRDPAAWSVLALSFHLGLGLLLTLGIAKMGAGPNYLLPLFVPVAVLAGMALAELPRGMLAMLVLLATGALWSLASYPFPSRQWFAERDRQCAELVDMVRAAPGPVLSENMTLLMRAGRPVPWEFGSITELTLLGLFDEAPLVKRLEGGFFDTLIVYSWGPERFSEAVRAAAWRRYERVAVIGRFEVWRRKAI